MTDPNLPTHTEGEGETLDMPEGLRAFRPGQVLGERYEIIEMLGRGGMGEVWRAFDLKLRVEVALKALRPDFFRSEDRRELLRQEVRAAREVMSPNVCRIFDLIEIEGRELVSMEYVDGATLLGVLQERGPLELKEAQDIASQFLAGLEAIHKVGLIHRDIKPENIMLTRAGRVVVMDFGLARQEAEGGGSVSGTPAYMSPEQAAGETLDARADVYSAGVVLAEMVSPDGIRSYESRQSVWEGVRSEPAKVPDTPWAEVIKKAVARDREGRFNTAHTLTRALEDVTLRVEGAEDLHPYPGLASFTEQDAEYFFGREAEVEQMWRKLDGPPRMLGLVGPSGAGKSSFLRAGLNAARSASWATIICTPGSSPTKSLANAFVEEFAGDAEAMRQMLEFEDPDVAVEMAHRWRRRHGNALLIVDQFEELFTQNAAEEQRRFADLLGRFVLEADVHVLLAMRDDFFFHCHEFEAFRPVQDGMTLIGAPAGGALRRALVQPATKCGYRFEDDDLIEEMLAEVEGERGALPLMAFAAARLWEKRDRETGLLTREAYHDIGGVGGALAKHAEATVDRIGVERVPIVRELFRNLVTADGTRAVREWKELLSIFCDSSDESRAEEVLRQLVDARLLTSYEVRGADEAPTRRVEIIHESLLANWPRLVRWKTQDQEGAQIRDELRQAARTWDDRGRHDDRLWTGTAFREYELWRERYPGGLTDVEEAFGKAMTVLAGRRRRRRRAIVTSVISVLVAGLVIVGSFWRRSVLETRRAEAQKLIALAQLQMEEYPTASLAYVTSSLELADDEQARFLALQALWQGPTAFVVNETTSTNSSFSPDGRWMVQAHDRLSSLAVISQTGDQKELDLSMNTGKTRLLAAFGGRSDLFFSMSYSTDFGRLALWSTTQQRLLATARPIEDEALYFRGFAVAEDRTEDRALFLLGLGHLASIEALHADGSYRRLGEHWTSKPVTEGGGCMPAATGEWFGILDDNRVYAVDIDVDGLSEPRFLGRHDGDVIPRCLVDDGGHFFLTFGESGDVKRWDPSGTSAPVSLQLPADIYPLSIDRAGFLTAWSDSGDNLDNYWVFVLDDAGFHLLRRLERIEVNFPEFDSTGLRLAIRGPLPAHRLWDLGAPAGADPMLLNAGPEAYAHQPSFSPDGQWLTTSGTNGTKIWPLSRQYASVISDDFRGWSAGMAFAADGRFLATSGEAGGVRVWPLEGLVPPAGKTVLSEGGGSVAVSPDGDLFAVSDGNGMFLKKYGEPPRLLASVEELSSGVGLFRFSPDGRFVAAFAGGWDLSNAAFHVWNIGTGEEIAILRVDDEEMRMGSRFAADGRLLTGIETGVVAWDIETREHELLVEIPLQQFVASEDGRRLLLTEEGAEGLFQLPKGSPIFVDLDSDQVVELIGHGKKVRALAVDEEGTIAVTGDADGIVRVGPLTGEEPHLLLGHQGSVIGVAVDPKGRWIASAAMDETFRLWPMPDLSEPPLHTLPREELIAKLKTLTNLRVVRDSESATGWKLTHDPFPGWETVPTW